MAKTITLNMNDQDYADCINAYCDQMRFKIDADSTDSEAVQKEAFMVDKVKSQMISSMNGVFKRYKAALASAAASLGIT